MGREDKLLRVSIGTNYTTKILDASVLEFPFAKSTKCRKAYDDWLLWTAVPERAIALNARTSSYFLKRRCKTMVFPVGVTDVVGDFVERDVVAIVGPEGRVLGAGIANISSEILRGLTARPSLLPREVAGVHAHRPVVDSRDLARSPRG